MEHASASIHYNRSWLHQILPGLQERPRTQEPIPALQDGKLYMRQRRHQSERQAHQCQVIVTKIKWRTMVQL